jgi:integrase
VRCSASQRLRCAIKRSWSPPTAAHSPARPGGRQTRTHTAPTGPPPAQLCGNTAAQRTVLARSAPLCGQPQRASSARPARSCRPSQPRSPHSARSFRPKLACPRGGHKRGWSTRPIRRRSTVDGRRSTVDGRRDRCRDAANTARSSRPRLRALIVVLWRGGLRIQEGLTLTESDLDPRRGSSLVRHGKGNKRREVGMDSWAWSDHLAPWLACLVELPVGPVVLHDRRTDSQTAVVGDRRARGATPVRHRGYGSAPVRAAPAPSRARGRTRARGGAVASHPASAGHSYASTTSVYLQGIDVEEIFGTIHARRAPMMQVSAVMSGPGSLREPAVENAGARRRVRPRGFRGCDSSTAPEAPHVAFVTNTA